MKITSIFFPQDEEPQEIVERQSEEEEEEEEESEYEEEIEDEFVVDSDMVSFYIRLDNLIFGIKS